MLMLKMWNYIRGYVIISVDGYFLEKFINICIHRNILLWDVKKRKNNSMTLKVSITAFRMLRPVAKKTGCRIRIAGKRGIPFILHRYKARKAFWVGAVSFIAVIYILLSFIWAVEVTGNDKIDSRTIEDKLASYGVKPGILKYGIDTESMISNLMTDINDLAWVNVVVKGTKVKVEVVEGIKPPDIVPKDQPCNIIATKDGVIKSLIVKAGEEKVKIGDTVVKGQLLISGTVSSIREDATPKTTHAFGNVMARTWYEASSDVNVKLSEKNKTGRKKTCISLVAFSKRFDLPGRKINYAEYEGEETKKDLRLGKDIIFPFQLIIDRYYENSIIEREIPLEEAKKNAVDKAYEEAFKDIDPKAQVTKKDVYFDAKSDGGLVARVVVECIEDIGENVKIGGN